MTTAIAKQTDKQADDKVMEFIPFGETKAIKLTKGIVRSHIAVPTRSGAVPSDSEIMKFMMLCQARELNPWVGDAYLVGYDTQHGPKYSLITAIQALLKRAEANPAFDGIESGVIVTNGSEVIERRGNMVFPGEKLVGGWAKCYRKDRSKVFYDALDLQTYTTGKSQWAKDPAGMIDKCAQASVLRMAFPTQLSGLYIEHERGMIERGESDDSTADRVIGVNRNSRVAASTLNERQTTNGDIAEEDEPHGQADEPQPEQPEQSPLDTALAEIAAAKTIGDVDKITVEWMPKLESDGDAADLAHEADARKESIRANRGPRGNQNELPLEA